MRPVRLYDIKKVALYTFTMLGKPMQELFLTHLPYNMPSLFIHYLKILITGIIIINEEVRSSFSIRNISLNIVYPSLY